MNSKEKIIELKNITFAYNQSEGVVLSDFSLTVLKGECLAIRGDNGSGKTTLFRIINGLSFPQKGEYRYNGEIINAEKLKDSRESKLFHKSIGYLFQNPDVMLFNGSVYDEIAFGPRQLGLTDAKVNERVYDTMTLLDIEELSEKAPYHLSGGQKKKVAIASVLSLNPDVLILDEPFAGMDQGNKVLLLDLLKQLKSVGKTIIMATHEQEIVKEIIDREVTIVNRL